MSDFGGHLKAARESRGVTLRQIAAATKISVAALEALERNDFSRLPGGIFSRAFVRAYALEVGLDPEATVATFLEEFERADLKRETGPRPEITADDRAFLARQQRAARMLRAILIAVVVLAVAALVVWQYRARLETTGGAPGPGSVESAPPSGSGPTNSPPPPSPLTATPAPSTSGPVAPVSAPAAPGSEVAGIAIHLEVSGDCWVRVRADGAVAMERMLHAGDTRDFSAKDDVYIQMGDSGAVTWTINGQPAKPLGTSGQPAYAHLTRANLDRFLR